MEDFASTRISAAASHEEKSGDGGGDAPPAVSRTVMRPSASISANVARLGLLPHWVNSRPTQPVVASDGVLPLLTFQQAVGATKMYFARRRGGCLRLDRAEGPIWGGAEWSVPD